MKILILCSGGDAPGMNRFVYTLSKNFEDVYYAYKGFKGLVEGDIRKLNLHEIEKVKDEAGAYIRSSRFPEFTEKEVFNKGLKNALNYDAVVVVGGNGSFLGAKELAVHGAKVFFVPATIDNDVVGSMYSLGFDTAVDACVHTVENCMPSFHTCSKTCLFKMFLQIIIDEFLCSIISITIFFNYFSYKLLPLTFCHLFNGFKQFIK